MAEFKIKDATRNINTQTYLPDLVHMIFFILIVKFSSSWNSVSVCEWYKLKFFKVWGKHICVASNGNHFEEDTRKMIKSLNILGFIYNCQVNCCHKSPRSDVLTPLYYHVGEFLKSEPHGGNPQTISQIKNNHIKWS